MCLESHEHLSKSAQKHFIQLVPSQQGLLSTPALSLCLSLSFSLSFSLALSLSLSLSLFREKVREGESSRESERGDAEAVKVTVCSCLVLILLHLAVLVSSKTSPYLARNSPRNEELSSTSNSTLTAAGMRCAWWLSFRHVCT